MKNPPNPDWLAQQSVQMANLFLWFYIGKKSQSGLIRKRSKIFDIKREKKTEQAEQSRRMRAFMKVHGVNLEANKEAVSKLVSKVDSDGEDLSVISSGKYFE